jgi:hypothetical protein
MGRRIFQRSPKKAHQMDARTTNEPTIDAIMQVGLGFWASKTLLSAIEMEVFTELAGRGEDLNTLQGRLGLHARSARDFLDALVALGFLQRINGKYSNTPSTEHQRKVFEYSVHRQISG